MRRTLLVSLPILILGAAPPALAEPLGRLARAVGVVESQPPMRDKVVETGMEVWTGKQSVAKIALGGRPKTWGAVTLGPESHLRFDDTVLQPGRFSFTLAAGKIRATFVPTLAGEEAQALLGVRPHEVQIDTRNAHISIYGSDVYIWLDPETGATRVYVREGRAEVTAFGARGPGAAVPVARGEMTVVPEGGGPPTPPRRPAALLLPAAPGMAGDGLLPDPVLKLRDPRWDLPK